MNSYRALIRENSDYGVFVRKRFWDAGLLDEMEALMKETVRAAWRSWR